MVLVAAVVFSFIFSFIPFSSAHILIIGDSQSDIPDAYSETKSLASLLKSKGYEVDVLYRENATSKNILKGMYGADAIIYAGHGGYETGNYNMNGGSASPPFALVGSDTFIWGVGDKMREGWNGKLFSAPIKNNIPVIMLQACFSAGWVDSNEVANPTATIYNFAKMFTGAGANYYATSWVGGDIIKDFVNGAKNFYEANNENYEKITQANVYKNTTIWRNAHGYSAFVGNWLGTFPKANETTKYDDAAAEAWYNSDRSKNPFMSDLTVVQVTGPNAAAKSYNICFTAVIKNLANVSSGNFYINYYLKLNSKSPNIYLGHTFITSLGALSSIKDKKTLLIPKNIASGKYYIAGYADANKNNAETSENNNLKISTSKTLISSPYKDLVSTQLSATLNANNLHIYNTVKNVGNVATKSFWVSYYLKKQGTSGLGDYVGHSYYAVLKPGSSKQQNPTIYLKTKKYSSKYILVEYIDPDKKIVESNKTNNIKAHQLKIV